MRAEIAEVSQRALRRLFCALGVYFAIAWTPTILLSLFYFADGGDLATSRVGGMYGVQAIFLHTNQLVVPVLFGWRLRDELHAQLAHGAAGKTLELSSAA